MREVLFHQRPQNPHRALVPKPVIQAMLVALMRLTIFSLESETNVRALIMNFQPSKILRKD